MKNHYCQKGPIFLRRRVTGYKGNRVLFYEWATRRANTAGVGLIHDLVTDVARDSEFPRDALDLKTIHDHDLAEKTAP